MPDVSVHQKGEINLPMLLQKLRDELGGKAGAVGCFVGVVRDTSKCGKRVTYLRSKCSEVAVKEITRSATDIEMLPGILKVMIHLIVDDLKPGEDTLYVLVAGEHRTNVFSALSQIVNEIKTKVHEEEVTEAGES